MTGNTSKKFSSRSKTPYFFFFRSYQHNFIMACVHASNQNQVLPPLQSNARPAIFNLKDGSISFVPQHLIRIAPEADFFNPQMIKKEYGFIRYPYLMTHAAGTNSRMIQGPCALTNHLFERDSRIIQRPQHSTNHLYEKEFKMVQSSHSSANLQPVSAPNNGYLPQYQLFPTGNENVQYFYPSKNQLANSSNLIQHSHLLQLPLSSNSQQAQGEEKFQLSSNETKSHQQSVISLTHQQPCLLPDNLPAVGTGMNQNSNVDFQQPCRIANCMSIVKHSPTYGLSHIEPNRNHVKGMLASHVYSKEATVRRGLQTIFQRPPKDGLSMIQNQKIIGHRDSYPSCSIPEIRSNLHRDRSLVHQELSTFDASLLNSNKYPQYSENVHICVVGPPGCGKTDLIRTFARNDTIPIPTGKPFRKVFQQGMVCFGTNLIIDIWQVDDLSLAAEDLKSHCESSKSVIVLVYNIAQQNTLKTVLEWIKFLKHYIVVDVPVILVENNTKAKSAFDLSEFSGAQVQIEYKLDAFYQCSTECIDDVEAVFLFAAHKAFHRKIQSTER